MADYFKTTLLVIPLYNHGTTVHSVVERALAAGWQVLVVDDGSTDGGSDQLAGLPCRIHRLARNGGKGGALMTAARLADEWGFTAMITVDADGQHDPAEAYLLAEEAAGHGPVIVIGNRRMTEATVPRSSLFGRAFSNFWVHLESGQDLPDTQSGFRLYPVGEVLQLPVRCQWYDFEVEVITRAAWAGIPIRAVSISVHYPPPSERQSHFHQFKDNFRLTCLHTMLVCRALLPWPHRKIIDTRTDEIREIRTLSMFHPVSVMKRLCREHSSALQLAVAAWVGFFLGALPLLACHTVAILYVCHRLHLNKLAAVAASQLCAPPLMPVLCMQLGYLMLHGHFLVTITWETMVLEIHYRLWEWFLGSLVAGPLLGLLVSGLFYQVIRRFRALRTDRAGDPEQVSSL
ncbi:MAG: DUF2062 domain-containing protein [Proteobacteria bacterium]|nr:DUF2062 domain-containing protein [Pseudomonadota bacterium]MBU1685852.1 DUF2062 domain-containing protein [Pseudomonadota bacterium]